MTAKAIVNGEVIEGSSSLGASYFKPDEPCGDVQGYLPQMLEEAATDLLRSTGASGDLTNQAVRAVDYLQKVMRKIYEAERKQIAARV